jgi:hypothetical protein
MEVIGRKTVFWLEEGPGLRTRAELAYIQGPGLGPVAARLAETAKGDKTRRDSESEQRSLEERQYSMLLTTGWAKSFMGFVTSANIVLM